jgi:NAD(P)-dependent dehydrogenase (short-subunit alcohol dehydrogenase family)
VQHSGSPSFASIFDASGKKVFIAGAGRGIGRGIAEVFAEAGADVGLVALTPRHVEEAAAKIAATSHRLAIPVVRDLTRPEEVVAAVDEVVDRLGRIDVLVNCVGDAIRGPLDSTAEDDIQLTLGLNLISAIWCCRAVAPFLKSQGGGKVINVSSVSSARGGADLSVYTAAKTGIVGLTRALALEWAPHNVQVNAISPGIFPDPLSQSPDARSRLEAMGRELPARRLGHTREVGYLALYLASSAADYVTGQTVFIDGGMSL